MYQIDMDIEHRFVFKPLGNKVDMKSTILIFANPKDEGGRIVRIQDRPVDQIPENSFINVSDANRLYHSIASPILTDRLVPDRPPLIQALRKMNAKVTPHILGIPQTEQEDQAKAEKFGAI